MREKPGMLRTVGELGFFVLRVVVVLALVSVALAMSYAIMRSQMMSMRLQANNDRGNQARQVALTGLSAGLRSIRLSSWGGVGSSPWPRRRLNPCPPRGR